MIFVPSPRALVHQHNDAIGTHFLSLEVPLESGDQELIASAQSRVFSDLRIMAERNRTSRQRMQNCSISGFFTKHERVASHLVHGLNAKANHDGVSAMNLLFEVAKKGDVNAMLELGRLNKNMCSLSKAKLWFTRAKRMGNIDALLALGDVHYETKEYQAALFFYAAHFQVTHSLYTAFLISKAFMSVGNPHAAMKWLRYCAAQGHHAAVQEIIAIIGKDVDMHSVIYQWLKIATRLKTVKQQPFFFSPLLNAKRVSDMSLPPLSAAVWRINDPFIGHKVSATVLPGDAPAMALEPKVNTGLVKLGNDSEQIVPFSGVESDTAMLLMILELATQERANRNLQLCEACLKRARRRNPTFPFDLHLWRAKCSSEDPDDLIKCGFVSCLLRDCKFGLALFQRAARSGNALAVFMCGIILFYGMHGERDVERGALCLARCQTDPVALIHLALISKSKEWARRAKNLMGTSGKCENIYECVGDLFFDGIEMVRNVDVALSWYYAQLSKSEKKGADTDRIVEKISRAILETMSAG